jgi:hypothetical protein
MRKAADEPTSTAGRAMQSSDTTETREFLSREVIPRLAKAKLLSTVWSQNIAKVEPKYSRGCTRSVDSPSITWQQYSSSFFFFLGCGTSHRDLALTLTVHGFA